MTDPQLTDFIAKHNVTVLNGTRLGDDPKLFTMCSDDLGEACQQLEDAPVFVRVGAQRLRVLSVEDEDEEGSYALTIVVSEVEG